MPTFTNFNDRLPDPTFGQSLAGSVDATGQTGPGFASIQVSALRPVNVSRTISGRGVHRETGSHTWEINITYNPMRRDQFDIVSSFLESRGGGRMNPFYVVLPQYAQPKGAAFAAFAKANVITVLSTAQAGASKMLISSGPTMQGTPSPGDFFTLSDNANVNHKKVYKVTRVETNALYQIGTTQPATNQARIHFNPPLSKLTTSGAVVNWINPAFRVIQKSETLEYSLNTDNLYQFQLQLEEIQP